MAKLTEDLVDEALASNDIHDVIGHWNWGDFYACPACDEGRIEVSAEKQAYWCPDCGSRGTALGFMMKLLGDDPNQLRGAVGWLLERADRLPEDWRKPKANIFIQLP